jgi:tight adherence protein B
VTILELVLFASGAFLLAFFILRTLGPFLKLRLEQTAVRRAADLREDFLHLSPGRILLVLFAAGTLTGSACAMGTRDVSLALAAAVAPVFLSGVVVRRFRARRRRRVIAQLPAFLDLVAGHIKAGHSLPGAFSETIPLLSRGLREEISWVSHRNRLGTPLGEALYLWERRLPCEEISLLVFPLNAALSAGGNIVDLLERTRDILRARHRMEEKLRSMTAQARLQAIVLTLLPPAFIAALSRIDPAFLPRCLGTVAGRMILAAAVILQLAGWLTIRKILGARP